ncbi:hypothetical protein MHAE_06282 [Mycobacterium haemophilum DSM 44634]|nr:hypothetical protein B586_06450 [Mycobacterium haemophilum DSM 44634]
MELTSANGARRAAQSDITTVRPSGRPLSAGVIGHNVGSARCDAGPDRIGAHRLRHTLASSML